MNKTPTDRYRRIMTSLICGIILLVLLAVDLVTKTVAEKLDVHQGSYFLGIIRLFYTTNSGMAFSWFGDNELAMTIITALTVVMIVGIAVLFFTVFKNNLPIKYTLAVIEAGAIGNLVDRLSLGYVRDFVDVQPIGFGVCNFADFFITFGAVVLIFIILFIGKDAIFPLKKEWREQARIEEERKEERKHDKK